MIASPNATKQSRLHWPFTLLTRPAKPETRNQKPNLLLLLFQLIKPPQIHRPLKQRLDIRIESLPIRILRFCEIRTRESSLDNKLRSLTAEAKALNVPLDGISGSTYIAQLISTVHYCHCPSIPMAAETDR